MIFQNQKTILMWNGSVTPCFASYRLFINEEIVQCIVLTHPIEASLRSYFAELHKL